MKASKWVSRWTKIGVFQKEAGVIHFLAKKYLLSIYHMPGTILGSEATQVNKLSRQCNGLRMFTGLIMYKVA